MHLGYLVPIQIVVVSQNFIFDEFNIYVLTNPAEYFHDDNTYFNEFLKQDEKLEEDIAKSRQIDMNNYLLEKPTALEQLAELMDKLEKKKEGKDFWVLYCYRPPSLNQKQFIPYRTGVIGIYKTLDELTKRLHHIELRYEYKDYQFFYAQSKLIESEEDYSYPLGFNEAF